MVPGEMEGEDVGGGERGEEGEVLPRGEREGLVEGGGKRVRPAEEGVAVDEAEEGEGGERRGGRLGRWVRLRFAQGQAGRDTGQLLHCMACHRVPCRLLCIPSGG